MTDTQKPFRGLVTGTTPGREDRIELFVLAGSYVVPGDVVGFLGQHNTAAGAKELHRIFVMENGTVPAEIITAKVACGEFVLQPTQLQAKFGGEIGPASDDMDRWIATQRRQHRGVLDNFASTDTLQRSEEGTAEEEGQVKFATGFTEKSTAPTRNWRDKQHRERQAGPKTDPHKELFSALNEYARSHGCWLISPPGRRIVVIESPVDNNIEKDLSAMGFKIAIVGHGSRLVGAAMKENVERSRYLPERLIHHAGEIETTLYEVVLPGK
jgi:hypothetical protein